MFDVKPKVEKKGSSTETDEGLGSSGKRCGSGSLGSGSLGSGSLGSGSVYLSDSQDWAVSPGCSPDEAPGHHSAISPALAQETFRYMTYLALDPTSYPLPDSRNLSKVLSSERMEQMTKTYNDIEVVTHLLAERDRDLELAARIGQSLLQRNHLLQERNEAIEEQLTQAIDQVHQLQHDLSKKDELLRMVASVSEESETDSSCSTPLCHLRPPGGGVAGATAALSQLEALQGKLQELEEENLSLRSEACHLKTETITYEEKEQRLVSDCVKELRESNSHMVSLTDELSQKNEALVRHQEEIAQLLSQIVELQHRVKELALEKEELRIHLQASKDAQRQLTAELNELAERHAECVEMLHESQEEIKDLHNKSTPSAGMRRHLSHGLYPMDSLAAEIEGTMRRELSVEEETTFQEQRTSQKRVFQTVRSVNSSVARASSATPPIPGSGLSSLVMTAQPYRSTKGEEARVGQPGSPGGNDLNDAIHRLSLRRHNFLCERQFFRAERERKLRGLAGPAEDPDAFDSPMGSALSSFSNLSELSVSSGIFKTFLPEKLQIVKPMEGSLTLHHWQQLAKPHLGTVLDPHPGVVTKGFRPLPQDTVYHLEDLEEDEDSGAGNGCEGRRDEGILEKGSAEEGRVKGRGYEEEEDGGIVFKVRCSSTPEEKKERTPPGPELCRPPEVASSSIPAAKSGPTPTTTTPHPVKDTISLLAKPLPVASSTPVQSEVRISTLTATTSSWSSVQNPGKCQSSTFSTYTFTTCRILHPSDVTQVTTSFQSSVMANTPSSMRTGPSTPVTPCRLSLGDSFPPRRPMVPPSGLTKLVLEKGISATQVSPDGPTVVPHPTTTKQPLLCLLPGTPPNSPSHSPTPSPVPFLSRPPAPADNFLASRPAELFLQDMYGLTVGRAVHPDLPSPSEPKPAAPTANPFSEGLVERLRRLGFAKVLQGPRRQDSSTFVGAGSGSLLDGLRRNQSLPAMIGAQPRPPLLPHLHPCHPPPPHPTSLALSPPPWGDPKEQRHRGRLASLSQPSSSSGKH